MAGILLENISKSFTPGKPVLDSLSLEIRPGELFFLLGPSGCGKSTLLRILAGLIRADSGRVCFDGVDVGALPPEKRQAAMVFQNYALWPHLSVFENVAFGLRTLGISGSRLREEVTAALRLVRMEECADRRVPSLSGGQQQRIALARALAVRPAVLLLDEPLSNLDARLRDAMRVEIARICRERGQTALYVTHDRQEALSMADRLAVLHSGSVRQQGTPREVYEHPADRFCAEFLGDVNFIFGVAENGMFRAPFGTFPLSGAPDGECTAAIRPERIRFASGDTEASFEAELIFGSYLGDSCEWRCRAAGTELLVREFAPRDRRPGDRVSLVFEPGRLLPVK